jgi:16S rRNA (adenine1518-N6/adenine1519-N6)-dimethyltransferase
VTPAELVRAYALPNKKRFGQHFLTQVSLLDRMVQLAGPDVEVIEVGPGPGTLTTRLLAAQKRVRAVELDRDAAAFLREVFAAEPRLAVFEGDATTDLVPDLLRAMPAVVVGNLPYNVGNEIMFRVAECEARPSRMVLMFQREVAERIVCTGASADFSLLGLGVAIHYRATLGFIVAPGAFVPPPKVESAVVVLDRRPAPLVEGEALGWYRRLGRAAFAQRRKMLRASLRAVHPDIVPWLRAEGIAETARPEELDVEAFVRLAKRAAASVA